MVTHGNEELGTYTHVFPSCPDDYSMVFLPVGLVSGPTTQWREVHTSPLERPLYCILEWQPDSVGKA